MKSEVGTYFCYTCIQRRMCLIFNNTWEMLMELIVFLAQDKSLDGRLRPQDRAEIFAFVSMIEGQLLSALLYDWFKVDENYYQIVKPVYSDAMSFPGNLILPWIVRCGRTHSKYGREGFFSVTPLLISWLQTPDRRAHWQSHLRGGRATLQEGGRMLRRALRSARLRPVLSRREVSPVRRPGRSQTI